MKNHRLHLLLLLLCCSCYRAHNLYKSTEPPTFDILTDDGRRVIANHLTIDIRDSTPYNLGLTFTLLTGNPEQYPITCSLRNLPPGIIDSPDSYMFKLNYQPEFSLTVNTNVGLYSAFLDVVTNNGSNSYPISLNVVPVTDCAPDLAGTYKTGSDGCGHFSWGNIWRSYTAQVSTVPGYPHWVTISNFSGLGDSITVYAIVQCNNRLDIPMQTTKGYTIYGRGTGSYLAVDNEQKSISIFGDTIVHGVMDKIQAIF